MPCETKECALVRVAVQICAQVSGKKLFTALSMHERKRPRVQSPRHRATILVACSKSLRQG